MTGRRMEFDVCVRILMQIASRSGGKKKERAYGLLWRLTGGERKKGRARRSELVERSNNRSRGKTEEEEEEHRQKESESSRPSWT